MFIGHGLLAFALVAFLGSRLGLPARRALAFGAVAGLFATIPDIDILYGPIGLLGGVSGLGDAVDTFWATGNTVHRGPTHSLIIGALTAAGFALAGRDHWPARLLAGGVLTAIVALTGVTSGTLDASIVAVVLIAGLGVVVAARRLAIPARSIGILALVGLLSHPFGDVLTGSPPDFFYPLNVVVLTERVSLHADATIHLLASFAVELGIIWCAVLVYFHLTERPVRPEIDPLAGLGAAYGAAVLVLPAPTVDAASPFVFSVLALGLVGVVPTRKSLRPEVYRAVLTGLTAVTLALVAYTATYLLV